MIDTIEVTSTDCISDSMNPNHSYSLSWEVAVAQVTKMKRSRGEITQMHVGWHGAMKHDSTVITC